MANLKDTIVLGNLTVTGKINGAIDNSGGSGVNVINANPTLAWSTQSTVATIGGTAITLTMPANPNTTTAQGGYADYLTGFSGRSESISWGTLRTGYSFITRMDTANGGSIAFADKNNQTSMQVDGFFYQNEGNYKVLDESGGTISDKLNFTYGGTRRLRLWADGEGANIRLTTPGNANNCYEIDTCDNILRIYYSTDDGGGANYKSLTLMDANGVTNFLQLPTYNGINLVAATDLNKYVDKTSTQTISGIKTFTAAINCSTISGTVSLFDTYKSYSSYGTGQYSGRISIKASNEGWVLSADGAYYGGDNLQSLRPQTSNYGRIGCDAYRFYETWVHNVKTYTIVPISQTASSGLTTNTGNIGNSSYYFANMWSYKINFSTTGSISDRRLKENIRPTNIQALEIIKQLSISEFQYKAKLKKDQEIKKQREQARKKLAQLPKTAETKELRKKLNTVISQRNTEAEFEIGLIAQELESVIPAQYRPAFITKEDTIRNSGEYSIKLNSVIYMAIKAIQEQQSIIETQQNKIDTLEEKISRLELIVLGDK